MKQSTNYEWFKFFSNNRKISKKHLNELRRQFEEYGNITEISPITTNPHGFIYDGQHRRILCEELGLPIFYIERDDKIELTPAMNSSQKRWTAVDYIEFFAPVKPEYKMLSHFMSMNGVNFYLANAALFPDSSSSRIYDKLIKGKLEISNVIVEAQKRVDFINEVAEIMGKPLTERYARLLLQCMYKDNFDINRFVTKLKSIMNSNSSHVPRPRATTALEVYHNIEAIYNFHTKAENTVVLFR